MKNIGLVTYVYEDYQDFIPLFVYSTLKNNPDIGIKIFLKEELTDYNRKTLEEVATNKVQVIENYSIPGPRIKLSGTRFLIPERDLSEFDYIYLSDIDFVNIEDMTKRCAQDIEVSKKSLLPFNGLCYNQRFSDDSSYNRFQGGSVFIEVEPYYEKMSRTIEEMHSGLHDDYLNEIYDLNADEILLYYMLDQTFQFDFELFHQDDFLLRIKQIHGTHLNLFWYFATSVSYCDRSDISDTLWIPDTTERLLLENIYENGTESVKQVLREASTTQGDIEIPSKELRKWSGNAHSESVFYLKTGALYAKSLHSALAHSTISSVPDYVEDTSHILDIGCATGRVARHLVSIIPNGEYRGLDIHKPSIDWAQQNISTKHTNFKFDCIDIYSKHFNKLGKIKNISDIYFPYEDEYFNLTFAAATFPHFTKHVLKRYFQEIFRVSALDSHHIFDVFCFEEELKEIDWNMIDLQHTDFNKYDDVSYVLHPDNPETAIAFRCDFLRSLILDIGFTIIESDAGIHSNWHLLKT